MTQGQSHRRFRGLVSVALIFTGIIFGSRYIWFLLALVGQAVTSSRLPLWMSRRLSWFLTIIHFTLYPVDLLFASLPVYLLLSVAAIVLLVTALVLARPTKLGYAALILGLLAVFALPLVCRYHPAVTVDPSLAQIRVPTQPGPLAGVAKAVRAGAEIRECDYTLLGWSGQDALYGEEICGDRQRYWVYWPMSDPQLQTVTTVPAELLRQEVSREDLRAGGVRSSIPHDATLRLVVREPGLSSAQGRWVAFVARHTYGPEDVIVVVR